MCTYKTMSMKILVKLVVQNLWTVYNSKDTVQQESDNLLKMASSGRISVEEVSNFAKRRVGAA